MKAHMYILHRNGNWEPWITIAPEIDRAYWSSYGEAGEDSDSAKLALMWSNALPLGRACKLVELWRERAKDLPSGTDEETAGELLSRLVASMEAEAEGAPVSGERRAERRRPSPSGQERLVQAGREELTQVERWQLLLSGQKAMLEQEAVLGKQVGELLRGRALLRGEVRDLLEGALPPGRMSWNEAIQLAVLLGHARIGGAVAESLGSRADSRGRRHARYRCQRCGSGEEQLRRTLCASCGRMCAYCEACLTMGRSRECELLVVGNNSLASPAAQSELPSVDERLGRWGLSPAQSAAASQALHYIESPRRQRETGDRRFLLWAVTGAGKTEMIFPLVDSILRRGGRALIATPRRDVVLELDPRIRKAFPAAEVVTLYGGSSQRWESGQITIATTHQLFRFHGAFDLVIVDEIDAYPYVDDPKLHYAAEKSCASNAVRLLLTATPPRSLQKEAMKGKLPYAKVPVRYHRHPLPVPKLIRSTSVQHMLASRRVPAALLDALASSLERGAQLFVFVQRIALVEGMAELLRRKLNFEPIAATSSQDPDRAEKVRGFRAGTIRILVTTTILERGVTIPRSDVFIMDADGALFGEAALVQMAGRAGRSADDPAGRVFFFARERNDAQIRAVRQIRSMNRLARRQGYLLPDKDKGSVVKRWIPFMR